MRLAWLLLVLGLIAAAALSLITPLGSLIELRQSDPALAWLVIEELRLPRTLLALGYGAVLGMTGAALQATFANPLASPDITGSSSGAALGAVAGSYWLGISGPLSLAACGAIGAALALIALFAVAGRRSETATLLLAGIAIALAAGACTSLLLALAPSPFAFYDSFEWLMGSFVDRSLPQAAAALVPAGLACALLARRSTALDMLALGDDVAASVGYRPRRLGAEVVALTAIAVGACVSVCGAIAFVGLIAPYAARSLTRGHPGRALLPAAAIGALLLVLRRPTGAPCPSGTCHSGGCGHDSNRHPALHLDRHSDAQDGGVMTSLLDARGLALAGRLQPTDLQCGPAEMIAVIGPNGAGKTSLLRSIAGIEADEGKVRHRRRGRFCRLAGAENAALVVLARDTQPDLADRRA